MKTRAELIKSIVTDELQTVVQLALNGDWLELEAWLGPLIQKDFESFSDRELKNCYINKGLSNRDEEEED